MGSTRHHVPNSHEGTYWLTSSHADKKLLVTSLQFLHNLVMHNEHRKLLLWLDLFGNSQSADPYFTSNIDPRQDALAVTEGLAEFRQNNPGYSAPAISSSGGMADLEDIQTALRALTVKDHQAALMGNALAGMSLAQNHNLARARSNQPGMANTGATDEVSEATPSVTDPSADPNMAIPANSSQPRSWNWTNLPDSTLYSNSSTNVITAEDMSIGRTPQSAAQTLQAAKDQLMARLQDNSQVPAEGEEDEQQYQLSENEEEHAEAEEGDIRGSDVAADGSVEEEDDEEDEEYRGPGDQERGLLTDIPLVLGPTEIEALPMIIQAGIVDGFGPRPAGSNAEVQKMQAVRCNILLAQEAGRNLLRELLIFIAAWDLTDDEFYFKMMQQIMEAILQNGLMPFAYQTFGE